MEPVPDVPYNIVKEDGTSGPSSTDYSGKAQVTYPNSDTYEGDFVKGVIYSKYTYLLMLEKGRIRRL